MRVDAKKLKSKLKIDDYKKIMKELDIPAFSENNNCIVYWSGEKNKNALNGSPKLYFYKSTGMYVGYTSGCTMDIIGLCQRRLTLLGQPASFIDALNFILNSTGIDGEVCQRLTKKTSYDWEEDLGKYIRHKRNDSTLPVYDKLILNQLCHSYPQSWIDEGISIDSMEKYGIGLYERTNAITIPCMDKEGNLIGIRTRNQRPDLIEQAKYIPLTLLDGTCYKFNTNSALYGLNYNWAEIERTKTVWLGESEKFCLKLDTWYKEKNVALGMFGKNLGIGRRNELLKLGVNKVIYVPDNDCKNGTQEEYKKWEEEIFRFAKLFDGYAKFEVVYDNLDLLNPKDNATDKDYDTWLKLYENREIIY